MSAAGIASTEGAASAIDERPERPWAFPRGTLLRFAEAVAPGSRAVNVRRLRGGLDAAMHALDLLTLDGARQRLVLRRYAADATGRSERLAARGWRMLEILAEAGYPAPRPVWFDPAGALFGGPALAMTRLPGRGDLRPRDHDAWLRGLGEALAALHGVSTAGLAPDALPGTAAIIDQSLARLERHELRAGEYFDGAAIAAALLRLRSGLQDDTARLAHGDYWGGNTLWRRGRLTGVVDWDHARLAPRGYDVGYCRLDLAMLDGQAAADAFLRAYEEAAGCRVQDLAFWELLAAARALPDPALWLSGYLDFSRTDITAALMRERLRGFVAAAERGLTPRPPRQCAGEGELGEF